MADPNFNNLLFTWLLLVFPVIYSFHQHEWSHRWAIWAAMWVAYTPVDSSLLRDLLLMVIMFSVVEMLTTRVRSAEEEWRRRMRLERLKIP